MIAGPALQQQQPLNGKKDPDPPLLSCPPAPSSGLCGDGLQGLAEYPRDLSRLSLPPALPGYCPAYPGLEFAELNLASLAEKLPSSSLLHKATLFSANPPRSGTHFFQMIQQHVNGKGRT